MLKGIYEQLHLPDRAATANFWQARPPQWQPHQWGTAAAATAFYYAKFRQDLGLGGLASRGGPEEYAVPSIHVDGSVMYANVRLNHPGFSILTT